MHSNAKAAFVKELIDIVNHVTVVSSDSHMHDIAEQDYMIVGNNVALVDEVLTALLFC